MVVINGFCCPRNDVYPENHRWRVSCRLRVRSDGGYSHRRRYQSKKFLLVWESLHDSCQCKKIAKWNERKTFLYGVETSSRPGCTQRHFYKNTKQIEVFLEAWNFGSATAEDC